MSSQPPELRSTSLGTVARAQFQLSVAYLLVRRTLLFAVILVALAGLFAMADGFPAILIDGSGDSGTQEPEVSLMFVGEVFVNLPDGIVGLATAFSIACLYGFLSAFRVWRDTSPRRRDYYWSFPVDRSRHDLIRVAIGGIPSLVIILAIEGMAVLGMLAGGHGGTLSLVPGPFWGAFLLTPTLLYLLASIATLRANRPATFVLVATGSFYVLFIVTLLGGRGFLPSLGSQLVTGPYSLTAAVTGPVIDLVMNGLSTAMVGELPQSLVNVDTWPAALGLWLAMAVAGVIVAARMRPRRG
jgi:hypothetical protein